MKQPPNYIECIDDNGDNRKLTYAGWSDYMLTQGVKISATCIATRHSMKRLNKKPYALRMVVGLDELPKSAGKSKEKNTSSEMVNRYLRRRLVFTDKCMVQGYCECGLVKGFE